MNPLVTILVSGTVLFPAVPLSIGIVILAQNRLRGGLRRLAIALAWLVAMLGICTAALPVWGMCLWIGAFGLGTLVLCQGVADQWRWLGLTALFSVGAGLLALEVQWVVRPELNPTMDRALVVLGDSLSAGLGEGEGPPWPEQLARDRSVTVQNLSIAGATTADGLRRVTATDHFPGIVIVELGGNDLLGGRSVVDFERDLEGILRHLQGHQRQILIVELPLIPGKNQWGVVQRRLTRRYAAQLIPKRVLMRVLSTPGATVDSLHLSAQGHQQLAESIWDIVKDAMPVAQAESTPIQTESTQP